MTKQTSHNRLAFLQPVPEKSNSLFVLCADLAESFLKLLELPFQHFNLRCDVMSSSQQDTVTRLGVSREAINTSSKIRVPTVRSLSASSADALCDSDVS